MDGLLVLGVCIVLAVPILIIALLIGQSNLRQRVTQLERALDRAKTLPEAMIAAAAPNSKPVVAVQAIVVPDQSAVQQPETALVEAIASPWDLQSVRPAADPTIFVPTQSNAPDQNGPIVMRVDRVAALFNWLKLNWVYAVSAVSLALAGVFFVQYGMEKGLLPPGLRVLVAMLFGAVLIAAGEWIRRRPAAADGDDAAQSTAYLPSVFSGAGLVSIFAAVLSARQMYDLIGPQTAFFGHLLTAMLAVVLGWFYGPLLAAVGLLGAAVAPFIVSGGSSPVAWLYGYFALIAATGLAVDAVRRWAWVSVLALAVGYLGGWLVMLGGAGALGWTGLLVGLAVMAVALPLLTLHPRHAGLSVTASFLAARGTSGWPPFPVRLAAGAGVASVFGLTLISAGPGSEAMLALVALTLLALAYLFWAQAAEGLADLALLPSLGFVAAVAMIAAFYQPLYGDFLAAAQRLPEMPAPWTVSLILGTATLISAGFALRSFRAEPLQLIHTLAAVLVAPVTALILELQWQPVQVIGAYQWALQVIALAALMVGLAVRYARTHRDMRSTAYATLSALSLIALALFLVATHTALTLALAVLVVVAAGLDRRFRLPEMGVFMQIGVAILGYRLLADPGVGWALDAPILQVALAFGGVIAALAGALWLIMPLARVLPKGVLESAVLGFSAIFANILITRWLLPDGVIGSAGRVDSYWGATLNAVPWLVLMLMQLYRARLGGMLLRLRQAIAAVAGALAAGGLAMAVLPLNPLFSRYAEDASALVRGPIILDTLLLAYAVPGLMLLMAALKMPALRRWLQLGFTSVGAALLALYGGLEIRRIWQGDWLGVPGVMQGELYTYTLALMLLGAALLYQAITKRSALLRRIGMAVIGLTVAKVFLIDASGLTGLTRVVSFLGLGLSLAGLAWLNRWAGQAAADPAS